MSGVVGKRVCANEPGLGEAMPLGNGRADPSSVPCLGLPRIFHAARGRASSRPHSSAATQRSTQNWHGLGESDCLIKTKHCEGPSGC